MKKYTIKRLLTIFFFAIVICFTYTSINQVEALSISAPSNISIRKTKNNNLKIKWNKVNGASEYIVYKKKGNKYHKIATVKKNKYTDKKVKKNKQYYYKIKTVAKLNGKKLYSNKSYYVSYFLESKKSSYTNVKKITIKQKKEKLIVGKYKKLKLKVEKENKKKRLMRNEVRWYSNNSKIAKVDKKGNVKGIKEGVATIYAISHDGRSSSAKIIVNNNYIKCLPILTFHRIVNDDVKKELYPNNEWVAAVSDFEEQMRYLSDNNYKTLSLDEFNLWYSKKKELPKKTALITIDDGDYELYHLVYPILKKYNLKATAFIIGSKTEPLTEELKPDGKYYIGEDKIEEIQNIYPNLEIQSHSYNLHHYNNGLPVVNSMTYDEIINDFNLNKKFNFNYIAYPYGYFTKDMIKAAHDSNMKMGFRFGQTKCATRNNHRYAIPRVKINGQISYNEYVRKLQRFAK